MVKVFTNGLEDQALIPDQAISKAQKLYLMPPCLTPSIIRNWSRVSGAILRVGEGAIENGAFRLPLTDRPTYTHTKSILVETDHVIGQKVIGLHKDKQTSSLQRFPPPKN